MTIALVAATNDTTGDGTLPDGSTAADQLMIAMIVHSTDTIAGLTGWTQFLTSTIEGAVLTTYWWIIRGVSAPDLTYTGGGTQYNEAMLVYSGTHLTTPIGTSSVIYRASGTTPLSESIDLIDPASWLLCATDVIGTSGAVTVPSGMTSRIAATNNKGMADLAAPADPSGTKQWTFASASDCHTASIEIRPPAGAATVRPRGLLTLGVGNCLPGLGLLQSARRLWAVPDPAGWARQPSGLLARAA